MISFVIRLITCTTVFISSVTCSFAQDPIAITKQMFAEVNKVKTLQYTFEAKERVNGKMRTEIMSFKIASNPLKIYVYQHSPKKGLQILFVNGRMAGKAKVNPGNFPWVGLNLDPEGDLMLENRHHSIFDAGFSYTSSIIEHLLEKYPTNYSKLLTYNGIEVIHDIECYSITLVNPNYRLTLYTAQEGETPLSIAKKLHINFYSILENNTGLKATSKIKAGTKLILPNDYASKMILYIQKTTTLPVFMKILDSKGVFEEFLFKDVIVNPSFKEIDFSEKNPEYKF